MSKPPCQNGINKKKENMSGESCVKIFAYTFSACTSKEVKFHLEVPVQIPYMGCPRELSQRILSTFRIPVFLEEELKKTLTDFIEEETQKYYNTRDEDLIQKAKSGEIEVENIIKGWEKSYKEQTVEYAEQKGASDEEVFAAAYHKLVHSSALDSILQTESSYAQSVQNVIRQRDENVLRITKDQTEEMDDKMRKLHTFTTEDEINHLAGKHFEQQSLVAGQWGSQLDALKQAQKSEYRSWLMCLLEDHQTSNSMLQSPNNSPLTNFPAVDNISTLHPYVERQQDRVLEESFTIHLGSQQKQMHNIRIISTDIMKFCKIRHLDEKEAPRRLQTSLSLYSNDLCGLVVLVDSPPPHYNGLAKKLAKACQQSTEFHFPNVEYQLDKIVDDAKEPVILRNTQRAQNMCEQNQVDTVSYRKIKDSKYMQTGDVYITKHSNLAEVHILFQLIADESSLKSGDINSRHPAILGLRNILKVACSNDVTTLTLPVLLRHDMSEEMTVAWCAKRAELVLKCVKGFMIEMASWGGSELKNIQFLVPRGISEEVFTTLAAMLPSIFRVSNPLKFKAESDKTPK